MDLDGLRAVANCGAWYAGLRRVALDTYLSQHLGTYAPTVEGTTVVFAATTDPRRRICAHRSPVASVRRAGASGWVIRWAWADASADLPTDLRLAEMRRAGERLGVAALISPELGVPGTGGPDSERADVIAATLGAVAAQLSGAGPVVRIDDADGGFEIAQVTGLPLAEPTFTDLVATLPTLLGEVAVGDHRVALHGLAVRLGWHVMWQRPNEIATPAGAASDISQCVLTDQRSSLALSFDVNGRPLERALPA